MFCTRIMTILALTAKCHGVCGVCVLLLFGRALGSWFSYFFAMAFDDHIGKNHGLIVEDPQQSPQRSCRIYGHRSTEWSSEFRRFFADFSHA